MEIFLKFNQSILVLLCILVVFDLAFEFTSTYPDKKVVDNYSFIAGIILTMNIVLWIIYCILKYVWGF